MLFFDPLYLLFALPGLLLSLYASYKVKSTFSEFSEVLARSRISGAQAARMLLDHAGIHDVEVELTEGFLSDHYDPTSKTLRLSPDVYHKPSLSAIGVACHEAGHAIQHAAGFGPVHLRSILVPVTMFSSYLGPIILTLGLFMQHPKLLLAGIIVFALGVVFTVVTLPVEWDASARAKKLMVSSGIVTEVEFPSAAKVLNAAFLTYVASAVSAILTLLYYILRYANMRNRD